MQILSFDVEEHWRIEAAHGLHFDDSQRDYYAGRVGPPTRWILEQLAKFDQKATFFVVGQLAQQQPDLVCEMADAGHEIACHSWDHQRIHNFSPAEFRQDLRRTRHILEDITGQAVVGHRAPTFSIVRETAWALDVLAEEGFRYDSSVYPVRHDRYGVPDAPRGPFLAQGRQQTLLEIPPARLDMMGLRLPTGGGGYFRLFPLFVIEMALRQIERKQQPPVSMLYFHPWEFDPEQERLPLGLLSRFRTYVGMRRSRTRFTTLLRRHRFTRTIDAVECLEANIEQLPSFRVAATDLAMGVA